MSSTHPSIYRGSRGGYFTMTPSGRKVYRHFDTLSKISCLPSLPLDETTRWRNLILNNYTITPDQVDYLLGELRTQPRELYRVIRLVPWVGSDNLIVNLRRLLDGPIINPLLSVGKIERIEIDSDRLIYRFLIGIINLELTVNSRWIIRLTQSSSTVKLDRTINRKRVWTIEMDRSGWNSDRIILVIRSLVIRIMGIPINSGITQKELVSQMGNYLVRLLDCPPTLPLEWDEDRSRTRVRYEL